MNALGVLLALATQVLTVKAADVAEKPVYVRIGVGVESRLLMPEALVRLHGPKPAADLLGLKLGQARPQALLMFRPREATTGRFLFVGPTREMRLVIESSVLGEAQDVEFRVVEAQPTQAAEPATAQAPKISPVAPTATADATQVLKSPSVALAAVADATQASAASSRALAPATAATQASTASSLDLTPCAVAMAESRDVTLRLRRRIGRPGQQAVFIEELRREGGRTALRLRVERGARVEIASLEVDGLPTALTLDTQRGDLVAMAVLPDPTRPPRIATLVLATGERWTRTVVPLAPAFGRLLQGGPS